jgi:hypothetical protein
MSTHEQTFWIVRSAEIPARYFVGEGLAMACSADQAHHFPTKEAADGVAEPAGMHTFSCRLISFR